MHILLISGEYPPMQGGVGDYTRELAGAFVGQGHVVSVLVSRALADAHPRQDTQGWNVLPRIDDWGLGCWGQIEKVIAEVQPDVIDVQYQAAAYDMYNPAINLLPWRLRRLRRAPPVVVTYHDLKPPYLFPKAGPLRAGVVRWMARYSDAILVTNAEDLAAAQEWRFANSSNLYQIPIGSNISVSPPAGYTREEWRTTRGYRPDQMVWAYFGFLNESKGGETLIRALAQSQPPAHLLMIGGRVGSSDPSNRAYADHIESLIDRLELTDRVRWTGYVPNAEVSAAFLSADVVVLPYRDGVSFRRGSLHAALTHGCPIVSTYPRVPLPELVEAENMLLVPPEDPAAISRAAQRLQSDPTLRRRIGQGAAALSEQFTWPHIAERTLNEVFSRVLRTR
jgi:glycosyltransferase involved in cell wall biosynthesis